MAPSKRVLFLTHSEYGQAQVNLSVAYELLSQPDIEVHLASFEKLRSRTAELSGFHEQQNAESNKKINFHLIDYPSMSDLINLRNSKNFSPLHPCGYSGALLSYRQMAPIILAWTPEQYLGMVKRCSELVDEIQPDLVCVDSLFFMGLDVCRQRLAPKDGVTVDGKVKYLTLTPLEFAAVVADQQPRLATWWKYPVPCSGFPFPVPWYLIPLNIFLRIRLILTFILSPVVQRYLKARKPANLPGLVPLLEPYRKDELYISPCLPELDYPLDIPSNLRGCGPITIPCAPVTKSDPELAGWLTRPSRRTVLINLGSHITSEGNDAIEIAKGLRIVMAANPDIQVLWKLLSGITPELKSIIGAEIADDRIRIVSWLKPDPVAILETGRVACMVNHGGANSYFEAIGGGTPQVILPVWYDTYGFANRAEWLGIGLWGSRKAAPGAEAAEFAEALGRVVGDGVEGKNVLAKARELGVICKNAGGRKAAAAIIVDLLSEKKLG